MAKPLLIKSVADLSIEICCGCLTVSCCRFVVKKSGYKTSAFAWTGKCVIVVIFNVIVIQCVFELVLMFAMVPAWPVYFLPEHFPHSEVKTAAGPVSARWISNSQGFHDTDHAPGKLRGKVRIVTIGDSFLDGPQHTPLPMVLSVNLENADKDTDVVNLSRPGIDVDLYYLLFKHALDRYKPDIVVVFIFEGNDFRNMQDKATAVFDQADTFFKRYPEASYYGNVFPRSSIFVSDLTRSRFVHRWSAVPEHSRWGEPNKVRSLDEISRDMTDYLDGDEIAIRQFLEERLTEGEIRELTEYGVRIDLLAYMVGLGLEVKFKPRLGVKERRPEITNDAIALQQVKSVLAFLEKMRDSAVEAETEFYTVLIPVSNVDPIANEMYKRLGADQDPLFFGTRKKQTADLKRMLIEAGVGVIDLSEAFRGESNIYLKFDTHWNDRGVEKSADYISDWLLKHSGALGAFERSAESEVEPVVASAKESGGLKKPDTRQESVTVAANWNWLLWAVGGVGAFVLIVFAALKKSG